MDDVEAIEKASFDRPYPRWFLEVLRSLADDMFLVAEACGRIVGYAVAVQRVSRTCHLVSIAVHPARRRERIGAALLASIEELCAEKGMEAVVLEVEVGNEPAQSLYRSFCYTPVTILPNYYGPGRHAELMVKVLSHPCLGV